MQKHVMKLFSQPTADWFSDTFGMPTRVQEEAWAAIAKDTVVAFLFDWSDYMFNTNYNMVVKSYEDNDTEDQVTKAVMICDGKVIDKNSLVTITKKNA